VPSNIVIVDYGIGNINSVWKSVGRMKVSPVVSSSYKDIVCAEKIILPGVGHFGKAMSNLKELNLLDALHEAVMAKQKPVLGICLGMELMAEGSEEGGVPGLGWVGGKIIKFDFSDKIKYKSPHIGWNLVHLRKRSPLMNGLPDGSEFYFLHSYYLSINDQSDVLSETQYEFFFPSAIEKGNIFGVQYHPEKSHDAGLRLLKNFIEL
jgi:glutamine amidotransferase